jgi:hypothetical protein
LNGVDGREVVVFRLAQLQEAKHAACQYTVLCAHAALLRNEGGNW